MCNCVQANESTLHYLELKSLKWPYFSSHIIISQNHSFPMFLRSDSTYFLRKVPVKINHFFQLVQPLQWKCKCISTAQPFFKIHSPADAQDHLALLSRVFEKSRSELCLFCTIGDMHLCSTSLKNANIWHQCLGSNILNGHRLLALFNIVFCFVLSSHIFCMMIAS